MEQNNNEFTTLLTARVNKQLQNNININTNNNINSYKYKILNYIKNVSISIIKEYYSVIIFLICISIFLIYRYYMKKSNKSQFIDDDYSIFKFYKQNFIRPTMNPYYPINRQTNYAIYPPDVNNNNPDDPKGQIFKYTFPNYGATQIKQPCYTGMNPKISEDDESNEFNKFNAQQNIASLQAYNNIVNKKNML